MGAGFYRNLSDIMIISASKIQGYHYRATPNLGTIGELMCWYDYRKGIITQEYSSILRVNSLADQSPNGFQLNSTAVNANITRPRVLTGGIGNTTDRTTFNSAPNPVQNILHNGSAYLIFSVAKLVTTAASGSFQLLTTGVTGFAGFNWRILANTRQLSAITNNNTGTNIGAQNTPVDSVPLDEFVLFQRLYYGGGTGTNNVKQYIADDLYQATFNPTFGTNNSIGHGLFNTGAATINFNWKTTACWNLTGKTPAECDDFRLLAVDTLKRDPEYSSLVTA
jgi:hypothetical protein